MAVLQSLPGIEVFVCVKGEALEEYDDDEAQADVESGETNQYQASKTVSKYIESVTDQEFAIKLLVGNPYYFDCGSLGFSIRVDGRKVRSPLLRRDEYSSVNGWSQDVRGIRAEEGEKSLIRPFKFAEIKKTIDDDKLDEIKEDANALKQIGDIEVWVYRKSEGIKADTSTRESLAADYEVAVHERALKGQAKTHGISLGEAHPTTKSRKYTTELLDGADHPLAIFKFKYRSKEDLWSLLVIGHTPPRSRRSAAPTPRPASIAASPSSASMAPPSTQRPAFNIESLSPAKKQQLELFLAGLMSNEEPPANVVQASPDNARSDIADRLKRKQDHSGGYSSSKRPRKSTKSGFIDLTDDD